MNYPKWHMNLIKCKRCNLLWDFNECRGNYCEGCDGVLNHIEKCHGYDKIELGYEESK